MLRTSILAASVAAALGGTHAAYAIDEGTAIAEANQLRVGGATATDPAFRNLFVLANTMCNPDTAVGTTGNPTDVDVFINTTTFDSFQRVLITCQGRTGNVGYGGQPILVQKVAGNSGTGSTGVASYTAQTFMAWPAPGCTGIQGGEDGFNTLGAAYVNFTLHVGCTATVSRQANAGIADVEARLLEPFTAQPKLSQRALAQVTFAPMVSLNLYRALQAAQGKTADDAEANTPSLSFATLAGIFRGDLVSWSDLDNDTGANLAIPAEDGGDQIFICGRNNGSGTQATFRETFTGQRCTTGNKPIVGASANNPNGQDNSGCDNATAGAGGACAWNTNRFLGPGTTGSRDMSLAEYVISLAGAADVRKCVHAIDAEGVYAIGYSSTESRYSTASAAADEINWRYLGVDDHPSTLRYFVSGDQRLYSENVWNVLSAAGQVGAPADAVLGGVAAAVSNDVVAKLGNAAVIAAVNTAFYETQGHFGLLSVPSSVLHPPTAGAGGITQALVDATPINSTRKSPTTGVNNCNSPGSFDAGHTPAD